MFLTFMPEFEKYKQAILAKKQKSLADTHLHSSVNLLLSSLASDYRATLAKIQKLTSHSEITFDLLYAILVPRTLFVTKCAIMGSPRLFKLISVQRTAVNAQGAYKLTFESVDLVDKMEGMGLYDVGRVETMVLIRYFKGTVKIPSLDAYPLVFHPDEVALREAVLKRGKKWVSLIGVHHRQYAGTAAIRVGLERMVKQNVCVMFYRVLPVLSNVRFYYSRSMEGSWSIEVSWLQPRCIAFSVLPITIVSNLPPPETKLPSSYASLYAECRWRDIRFVRPHRPTHPTASGIYSSGGIREW
jgi:hypothetical protein